MTPVIGIAADLQIGKKSRNPRIQVDVGYADGIIASGGLPIILPPFGSDELLEQAIARLDGILMVGGDDLDPRRLGRKAHQSSKPMLARREDSDRLLAGIVRDRKIPALCVGVSMQLMNVLCGGTLYTHLPEDMPRGMPHADPHDPTHRHVVFITPRTRLEELYGEGEIRVNSSHHQGIRTLGKGLRSSALAPDGLIEAFESADPSWYMLGVQWHPESDTASALDKQLFDGFMKACRTRREAPKLKVLAA
jgi:putative glutamine amidotransferase